MRNPRWGASPGGIGGHAPSRSDGMPSGPYGRRLLPVCCPPSKALPLLNGAMAGGRCDALSAATGPRPSGRGDKSPAFAETQQENLLQWGHGHRAVETRQRRRRGRAEALAAMGHGHRAVETRHAADHVDIHKLLPQWGHGRQAMENWNVIQVEVIGWLLQGGRGRRPWRPWCAPPKPATTSSCNGATAAEP
jgi:hypothetical protein